MAQDRKKIRLQELAHKWLKGTITPPEQQEFDEWFKSESHEIIDVPDAVAASEEAHRMFILERIQKETGLAAQPKTRRLWVRVAAAASILICCSIGFYRYQHKHKAEATTLLAKNTIAPGSNKAILTLASGKKIILTEARNGQLAKQENTVINKTAAGQITYVAVHPASEIKYDTLAIPRNGQFQLKLPDGTKVWLNAATSIRYPEDFTGNKRQVELISGEAYFEVAHDASKPFSVLVKGQEIEDIGTHFNIDAYDDEPDMKTTLLEGSVRVAKDGKTALLRPGQAAITKASANTITVQDADTEEAIAWKNGYFKFDNENIQSIMRKVSRWYDVDIQYEGPVSKEEFGGKMSRYKNVSEVLQMLELTKSVHFKIEGRRITVMQ